MFLQFVKYIVTFLDYLWGNVFTICKIYCIIVLEIRNS